MSENLSADTEIETNQVETPQRFMDRHLPPKSFRRVATIAGFCLAVAGGALHFEVGRLKDSQESGIGGVRTEVANQGAGIRDPLLVKMDEASETLKQGEEQLKVCQRVADKLGLTEEEPQQVSHDQAAGPPATIVESTTSTTSTSTTVVGQP